MLRLELTDFESKDLYKSMARILFKYRALNEHWDRKRISVENYCLRIADLEHKMNMIVHAIQSNGGTIKTVYYRNLDARGIVIWHKKIDITDYVFSLLIG